MMRYPDRSRRLLRRATRRRREQGIVMLVVMMVLLMATVSASIAIDASYNALRAAGHHVTGTRTRYMAEAALHTAVGFIEIVPDLNRAVLQGGTEPNMQVFGWPSVDTSADGSGRHHATRLADQALADIQATNEYAPVQSGEQLGSGTPFPSEGGGFAADPNDVDGTTGRGVAWYPGRFAVDMYDCFQVTRTLVAGEAHGASTRKQLQCTFSARGRHVLVGGGSPTNTWTWEGVTYQQTELQSLHEAQMTIITPEF